MFGESIQQIVHLLAQQDTFQMEGILSCSEPQSLLAGRFGVRNVVFEALAARFSQKSVSRIRIVLMT